MGSHTNARRSSGPLGLTGARPQPVLLAAAGSIFLRMLAAQNLPPSEPQRLRVSMATPVYSDQKPVAVPVVCMHTICVGPMRRGRRPSRRGKGDCYFRSFCGLAHTARPRTPHLSTRYCNRRLSRRLFFMGCRSSPLAEVSNGRPAFAPCRTRTWPKLPILARRCATRGATGGLFTLGSYKR
jgi:hypothetical protein